jgi:hypothetical protein
MIGVRWVEDKKANSMSEPDRLPTEQEIIERLLATRKKPKLISKPSVAQRAARFNPERKPTIAIAQDVTLSSDALAQRLREERRQAGLFSDEEIARRQAALDRAVEATRGFQREISYAGTCHRGPLDPDWGM